VPCGLEVTLDQNATGLHGLVVMGSLRFQDGVDIVLETDHILVCGRFSIGSNASAHAAKVEIVLTGQTAVQWRGKDFGSAPFATYGGELYIRGTACGHRTWAQLSAPVARSAQAGSTNLALRRPTASSSVGHRRHGAWKGVDGGYHWKKQSTFTRNELHPWWSVNVGASAAAGIQTVVLTRKTTDLSKAQVGVAEVACQQGQLCGGSTCKYKHSRASRHRKQDVFDCGGARGTFVYVQLPSRGVLSLVEVEVFASPRAAVRELTLRGGTPVSWRPGDRVLITATGYDARETEEATVLSVEPGRVKVSGAFAHDHDGCDGASGCIIAAEVAPLNRNVVIRGRSGCKPKCGHFMLAHTHHGFICGAEFTNLGQTAVEGRYPLHIHLPGDAPDLVVNDNVLHHNHNRGVVMHGVHGMLVQGNTCYRTRGHCFMTEDAVEQHNRILLNLGVLVEGQSFGCSQSHDNTFMCAHRTDNAPNAFWISNPNNIFDGNVGVTTGNAFFIETRHVMGLTRRKFLSEAMKVGARGKIKGSTPLGQFTNNVAHSCNFGLGNYPRIGWTRGGRNAYENFTAWRCEVGMAAHAGSSVVPVRGALLVQNTKGIRVAGGRIRVSESRIAVRPHWSMVNKKTRYVSTPLIFHEFGKASGRLISAKFTLDNFTVNWVRCRGGYDSQALSFPGWRGDWFALFKDKAKLQPCNSSGSK
jgi:hypothetical protein